MKLSKSYTRYIQYYHKTYFTLERSKKKYFVKSYQWLLWFFTHFCDWRCKYARYNTIHELPRKHFFQIFNQFWGFYFKTRRNTFRRNAPSTLVVISGLQPNYFKDVSIRFTCLERVTYKERTPKITRLAYQKIVEYIHWNQMLIIGFWTVEE